MITGQQIVILQFPRFVEKQVDVDHFIKVWDEEAIFQYTLQECKELLDLEVVNFEMIFDAALQESWSEEDMNSYKYELEFTKSGSFWFSQDDVDSFEKRLKKYFDFNQN